MTSNFNEDESQKKDNYVNPELIMKKFKILEESMSQFTIETEKASEELKSYSRELQTITKSVRHVKIEHAKTVIRTKNYLKNTLDVFGSEMEEFRKTVLGHIKQLKLDFEVKIRDYKNQITAELNQMKSDLERAGKVNQHNIK